MKYDHKTTETKWQQEWERTKLYCPKINADNKFYNLFMFPYPSAEGLHAGHAFSSTGSDVIGRYQRMNGKSVFQPIGYDSFGMHSENYALKIKDHPADMLQRTTANYEHQLRSLGHGYDWTRTVTTSNLDYYQWTQWLFVQIFKAGLAYRKKSSVNWCSSCKTVLADEQVIGEECERCGTKVEKKDLAQWFFRITDYADKLLDNINKINWSEKVLIAQRNWIGKKQGINITYNIKDTQDTITCWTSRPDTNFGATFIVVSPEHSLANKLATVTHQDEVSKYIKDAKLISKEDRVAQGREKTGVFTGRYAINSLNGYKLPIYIADFVLADVGTGAVVGVPGHDLRDFEFAQKFNLPIIRVVVGSDGDNSEIIKPEQVQEQEGTIINSEFLNGLEINQATEKIMDYLEEKGWGKRESNYHLRDWLISRQRYWGPPIPMIYCEACAKENKSWFNKLGYSSQSESKLLHHNQSDWDHSGWYPEENLPVKLPKLDDYQPKGTGRGPLADHPEFYNVRCPECGKAARRETDVSDTFLDSSWYFLAYPNVESPEYNNSPSQTATPLNQKITKNWLPVDLYFGGAEHSVLHLMYARFVTQVLNDLRFIDFDEPFPRFFAHGLMIKDGAKMSKSRGNVVNPDEYIAKYGADTLRMYLMFLGPMDGTPDFRDTGIEGMKRFIDRLWDIFNTKSDSNNSKDNNSINNIKLHQTIKKVTNNIQHFHYNTAISTIMEYTNYLRENSSAIRFESQTILCQLIAPFAPHLAEEVWINVLKQEYSVHTSTWPKYDENLTIEQKITLAIQINGKLRGSIEISQEEIADQSKVSQLAKNQPNISKYIKTNPIKEIYIPGKIINFVV